MNDETFFKLLENINSADLTNQEKGLLAELKQYLQEDANNISFLHSLSDLIDKRIAELLPKEPEPIIYF